MAFKLLTTLKNEAVELLFPIKCVVCEKETGHAKKNKLICTNCLKSLTPSASLYCPLCEAKTIDGGPCFSCKPPHSYMSGGGKLIIPTQNSKSLSRGSSISQDDIGTGENGEFKLDKLFYPFSYKEPAVQKIIKAFKYHFIKDLETPLGFLLAKYLGKIKENVGLNNLIIVPVPLHKIKFNQRGYNQSELIAMEISKYLKFEIFLDCLVKIKITKDQASLKNEQRTENLNEAFKCLRPELVSGRKILLVDDVYTTGATMQECAKVLKEAGAKEIIGLAIARG